MKQLHSEISDSNCYRLSQSKEINVKSKQRKTEQLFYEIFFQKKYETKTIKISVLYCLPAEKCNTLLECLLPCTHPIVYPKCMGNGIQTTATPYKLSYAMTVYKYRFHNDVMAWCRVIHII